MHGMEVDGKNGEAPCSIAGAASANAAACTRVMAPRGRSLSGPPALPAEATLAFAEGGSVVLSGLVSKRWQDRCSAVFSMTGRVVMRPLSVAGLSALVEVKSANRNKSFFCTDCVATFNGGS